MRVRYGTPLLVVLGALLLAGLLPTGRADEGEESARSAAPHPTVQVLVAHADGMPTVGARVSLRRGTFVETDRQGRATLDVPTSGRHRVWLHDAPGVHWGWMQRHLYSAAEAIEAGVGVVHPAVVHLVAPRGGSLRIELDRKKDAWGEERSRFEVAIRRFYPDGSLWGPHDQPRPSVEKLDADGRRSDFTFSELPEGRYRVRTYGDRPSQQQDVEVKAGVETVVVAALGPPAPTVTFHYEGPVNERGHQRCNVNSFVHAGPRDLVRADFEGPKSTWSTRSLRPGRYAMFFWDLRLAMLATVPGGEDRHVNAEVPDAFLKAGGERTLIVELWRDGSKFYGLPVLLAPVRTDPLASGRWYWFSRQGTVPFENLVPGTYDVLVLDGGFGGELGIQPNPIVRRIQITDQDLTLRIDLQR